MDLTTTKRGSSLVEFVPSSEDIMNCMALATTSEAAIYFKEGLVEKLAAAKMLNLPEVKEMLTKVEAFAETVVAQRNGSGSYWDGSTQRTDFERLQQHLAEKSLEQVLPEINQPITMDFAISDEAQILRGFSKGGNPANEKTVDSLDKLFNAWLAEKGMLSKGSVIYESTAKGEIRQDKLGNQQRAQAEKLRNLIIDKNNGFANFLKKKGVNLTTQQHQYPEQKVQKVEVQKQQAAKKQRDVLQAGRKQVEEGGAEDYEGVKPSSQS